MLIDRIAGELLLETDASGGGAVDIYQRYFAWCHSIGRALRTHKKKDYD